MSTPSNAVGWFEIYVADMERAKTFYRSVLQRELSDLPSIGGPQMCAFSWEGKVGGCAGALVKSDKLGPGSGGTLVYFSCDDCALEQARVAPAGGQVWQAKMPIGPYGFIAIVQDSEGNTIGLHSMK